MGHKIRHNSSLNKAYEDIHGAMRPHNRVIDLVREVRGSGQEKQ